MQKTIDQITDHLAGLVTADKPFYTPKELLKAKIPSFVVERVRLTLEDKVKDELSNISTAWFDRTSKLVAEARTDFEQTAIGASHIPKDQLYTILNGVVSDIIHVFIEPRKNMADYIFRDDDELSFSELEHRCARLTVYKHFGTAIPLYMEKRGLEALTKERCQLLIQKIDAKLVAAYKPEDWAQKLEQLFILFGGEVEPKLLVIFFEDKGLPAMARKFASKRKLVTKTDFIHIISAKEAEPGEPDTKSEEEQSLVESFFGEYTEDPTDSPLFDDSLANQYLEGGLSDEEMSELLYDIANEGVIEVNHEHVASLNELFHNEAEPEQESVSETSEEIAEKIKNQKDNDPEEIKEFRENLISILDQAKHSFEDVAGEQNVEDKPEEETVDQSSLSIQLDEDELTVEDEPDELIQEEEETEIVDESGQVEEESGEEPMWAKFLNPDQMDVMMGGKRSEERLTDEPTESEEEPEIEVSDAFDDPIIEDEAEQELDQSKIIDEFTVMLDDRKAEFVEVIFKSSDQEFEDALVRLSGFKSWKEASDFIKNEIFTKNDVDLFSGATVDFTDRMHRYFNEQIHS